jgi:hypothetical protein
VTAGESGPPAERFGAERSHRQTAGHRPRIGRGLTLEVIHDYVGPCRPSKGYRWHSSPLRGNSGVWFSDLGSPQLEQELPPCDGDVLVEGVINPQPEEAENSDRGRRTRPTTARTRRESAGGSSTWRTLASREAWQAATADPGFQQRTNVANADTGKRWSAHPALYEVHVNLPTGHVDSICCVRLLTERDERT